MVYSLTYRRPSMVPSPRNSISGEERQRSIDESVTSGSSGMSHGIPEALSFDRIIAGGVCPVSCIHLHRLSLLLSWYTRARATSSVRYKKTTNFGIFLAVHSQRLHELPKVHRAVC